MVEIYRRTADSGLAPPGRGSHAEQRPLRGSPPGVRPLGTFTFAATTGGAPGSGDELSSNQVTVTVEDSKVALCSGRWPRSTR